MKKYQDNKNVRFYYDSKSYKCGLHLETGFQLEIDRYIKGCLGFRNSLFYKSILADEKIGEYSLINVISSLYVYCDIIDYQFVGDSKVQLLRTVSTHNSSFDHFDIIYDSPHYLPVNKKTINTINIFIASDTGDKILFNSGKVFVKLHFKQK